MEGIIKLKGKILGISPEGTSSIKLKISYNELQIKDRHAATYQQPETLPKCKTVSVSYAGPAHIDKNTHQDFHFAEVEENSYGIGTPISNLFIDDDVEIYASWHTVISTNDTQHRALDTVIVTSLAEKPMQLSELIRKI